MVNFACDNYGLDTQSIITMVLISSFVHDIWMANSVYKMVLISSFVHDIILMANSVYNMVLMPNFANNNHWS